MGKHAVMDFEIEGMDVLDLIHAGDMEEVSPHRNLARMWAGETVNMGKEVLAEGVEREEQRQKLLEWGWDYGQGFLWGYPQSARELEKGWKGAMEEHTEKR